MRHMILLLAVFLIFPACSEDKAVGSKSSDIWPDRTDMEDCVDIILMAYEQKNIEKYEEVLLEPDGTDSKWPEGYIWYNQQQEILEYGESYTYLQERDATIGIFDMSTSITLDVYSGSWQKVDYVRGQSCESCYESIRGYHLDMSFKDGERYIGDFYLLIIVGSDREDENKYVIYQANDLFAVENSYAEGNVEFDVEDTSWGALKSMYGKSKDEG